MKTNHGMSVGLVLLGAGLIAWMFTTDWRYAVAGVIAFVVAGVIGAGAS